MKRVEKDNYCFVHDLKSTKDALNNNKIWDSYDTVFTKFQRLHPKTKGTVGEKLVWHWLEHSGYKINSINGGGDFAVTDLNKQNSPVEVKTACTVFRANGSTSSWCNQIRVLEEKGSKVEHYFILVVQPTRAILFYLNRDRDKLHNLAWGHGKHNTHKQISIVTKPKESDSFWEEALKIELYPIKIFRAHNLDVRG